MRRINNRKKNRKKLIAPLLILVIFIVGIAASFILLNSSQDLRQQADSGAYSTTDPTVATSVDEPNTGEFGWNYTTGQAATTDDWANTDVEIAGTYIQCNGGECKRYVVNIQATHDALEAYSEARKKENGKCSQALGGFCVAWEEDKSSETEQVAETEEKTDDSGESNEGSRCTQSSSCSGGTVCAYSPYGAFCVNQEDAGAAEILAETEILGEDVPTNSLGYSSSMECVTRCGSVCGGPGGKYCPIPESELLQDSIQTHKWDQYELQVTEEDRARVENKLALVDSRTDAQAALMNYLETGDINHLKENEAFGKSLAEITSGGSSDDPEVLLQRMLGEEKGTEAYQTYALPQILGNAINSFSQNPDELEKLCSKTLGSNCNLSSSNAAAKLGKVFEAAYGSNPDFNTSEVAVLTANQLFVEAKEEHADAYTETSFLGNLTGKSSSEVLLDSISDSDSKTNLSYLSGPSINSILNPKLEEAYKQSQEDLKAAIQASQIFNPQDTFEYASTTSVREDLSDFTYGTTLGNAFMHDNVFDREYDLEEDLGLTGVDAASMTWNQVITQGFNVQNTTENIATNYAIAQQEDYSGPANTNVADISFQAAQNLGGDFEEALNMDYQAATDGHYAIQNLNNASATLADWSATVDTFLSTDTTDLTFGELTDIAGAAGDEAGESVRQEKTEKLAERHNEKVVETGGQKVDIDQFISFQTDEEIVRSKKELDWEVAEKVVAPAAALVVLPVAIAAGAGAGVIAGASSSVFSFYQGAGMKTEALELNRVEISENVTNRKNLAALDLMESYSLGGEEISYEDALGTIEDQVDMLEKQGNMMLASSAVASLTSGAGIINGFSQTGQAAMASGQAVSRASQLALNSSRVSSLMSAGGRIGGLGLSGLNTITSGQQTYESFKSLKTFNTTGVVIIGGVTYDKSQMTQSEIRSLNSDLGWQTGMSGFSTFAAGSGVIGNAGGMINGFNSGFDTALTKTDYVLDMMNIPVGVAIDAKNVSDSCFNSAYPSDEKSCGDAWVGLALSFTQDLASKHSSTQAYLAHKNSGADYVQKISLVDQQLAKLLDNPNKTLGDNLEITDLRAYREDMVVKALVVNSGLEIPEVVRKKTTVAAADASKLLNQAMADRGKILSRANQVKNSDPDLFVKLVKQADDVSNRQIEISKLDEKIAEIDQQINTKSLDAPKTEIDELTIQRKALVDDLTEKVNDSNFKSSKLDPGNKLLLAAAKNNETFKVYEELRAAQDQVSAAAEKQNIPPPKKTTEKIAEFVKDPVNITKAGVGGVVERVKNFSFSGFVENSKTNIASSIRNRKTKTVKSKLTDTKNAYDQLTKSQDEIRKSNTEISRLDQELVDLNKIERDSGLDVDQDFRRSEILGEISSIKKTLKIFSSDATDLEFQLSKSVLADSVVQKLSQAQENGDLKDVLQVVRVEEIIKLTENQSKSGLSDPQIDLIKEITVIKDQIVKTTVAEDLLVQRDLYNEKMTELSKSILGESPKLEDYQKLSTDQEFIKNIDLFNSVDSALAKGKLDSITDTLATREVKIDVGDPLLAVRLETIIRDAEFRTGVSEGIDFFNTRSNQMDTFLKIFEGEKVAIELTTAGGKTFVGSVLLKAQVEILGYKTGSYIAKDGQEVDIQQSMMKAYGVGEDEVVILDSTRLSEEGYVETLQNAKFIVANPSNIQFIRNSANNFKDPNFKVANAVYTKLTQDTALYIDELQINLDPSRQAINPVGENSKDIPEAQKAAAEWVGDALKDTLLDKSSWGLGEHDFLTLKTKNDAEIAKFNEGAQKVIFDGLAQRSQDELNISREAYDAVKNNASELDAASYSPDFLKQELSKLGIDISTDNAIKILDQIDMVNTFAQGLKMKSGTDYHRMVDTVLRDNGGLDRVVTVPASGANANEGQSYNAKLQAAMEYIGSKANNEPAPNFDGLKSSPELSYKSTIADFLGDLKNSSVGAVTGALADGKGVAETSLGLVTYRSTEAVEKILSIAGSSTGERISVDRSFGINRDDDVAGVVALKQQGNLDQSAGLDSDGNLKIVMGFDGAKNPLDFAIEMAKSEAFVDPKSGVASNSKFAVQKADGSYSLVKIDIEGNVIKSEAVTTKEIQDLYKNGETNLVTIIGRGGATGDSIATSKNIPGITVTSDSAPEGLVAQSGARIDRISGEVAEQYALIVSRGVDKIKGIDAEGFLKINQMTQEDFQNFRNNVEKVQLAVEQAKNTVGLDQGVLASSTRVLSDLIRNSKDPKIQEWASARLLEFSSSETTRDLDLNGGDQETLLARQKKIAGQVAAWEKLFTHKDNAAILKKIKRSNSDLYKEMLGNSAVDSQKLSYADSESTSKEAVMTARNLSEFVERHNKYVVADSESKYVASSGQKPVAQQIATASQKNSIDGGKAGGAVARVEEEVDYLRGFGLGVANPLTFAGKVWSDRGKFVSSTISLVKNAPGFVNNIRIVQRDEIRTYRGFRQDIEEREQELVELDEKIASLSGDEKRDATERKAKVIAEIESRKKYLDEDAGNMVKVGVFIADIPSKTVKIAKNQFSSLSSKREDGKSILSGLGNISEKIIPGFAKTGVWIADLSKKIPGTDKLKTQWVVIKDEASKKIAERKEASDEEGTNDLLIRIISTTEVGSAKIRAWLLTDPAVIEKREEIITELKIKDGDLVKRIEKAKTIEALDEIVAERRVAYQKLVKKLTSLGIKPKESLAGENGNEEKYQNEIERVSEIERLQRYSGLRFAAMNDETGHFAEQADGSVFRLNEFEHLTFGEYRDAAENEIGELGVVKLAEKKVEEDGLEKSEEDTDAAEVDYLRGFEINSFSIGGFISDNFQLGKNKLGSLLLDKPIPGSAKVIALANNIRANAPDFSSLQTRWVVVRDGATNKIAEGKESTGFKNITAAIEWSKTTSQTVKSLFVEDAEIAKRKRDILIELAIKDAELKNELNKIQTADGLNEFVAGRKKVYQGVVIKLTSLGTKPQKPLAGENGNETRYQNELKRIAEIEQLQKDSLLVFVEMDEETGHFLEQENGAFERVGEYKDLSLGEYIKRAGKRINELEAKKIAEADEAERVTAEEKANSEPTKFNMSNIRDILEVTNISKLQALAKEKNPDITGEVVNNLNKLFDRTVESKKKLFIISTNSSRFIVLANDIEAINQQVDYLRSVAFLEESLDDQCLTGMCIAISGYSSFIGLSDGFASVSTSLSKYDNNHFDPNKSIYEILGIHNVSWKLNKGQIIWSDLTTENYVFSSLEEGVEKSIFDGLVVIEDEQQAQSKDSVMNILYQVPWDMKNVSPESHDSYADRYDVFERQRQDFIQKKEDEGDLAEKQSTQELADAKTAAIGVGGLNAEENESLLNEINSAEDLEAVNSIVTKRKEVDYKNLQLQFSVLGTSVRAINNEADYKNELDRLSQIIIEIEDLQNKSGLDFVEVGDDNKVPTTEGYLYEIARVDDGKVLSKFITEANREIKKLAGKNGLYYQASLVVESLSKIIPTSLALSELNSRLREISILRDSLDENHEWIALREGSSNENPLAVLVSLSKTFGLAVEFHASLVQDAVKLAVAPKGDLESLSIEELEKQIEEKKEELLVEENKIVDVSLTAEEKVYRQLEEDFSKLGIERKITNEADFTESLEELEIIVDQILIKEDSRSEKFFVDGASKKFDEDNVFVGYEFEVLSEAGYFEFLEVIEPDFNKQLSGIGRIQEFTFELEKLIEKRSSLFLPLEHLQSNIESINRIAESLDLNLFADRSLKDRISIISETFSFEEKNYRISLSKVKTLIKELNLRGIKVANTLDGLRKQREILENFSNKEAALEFSNSAKKVDSFEVTRLYDNGGKRVDGDYLLNQSNVRSFLVDSFLDGSLYESGNEDTFIEKISQAHRISNRNDVYQKVGEGSLGVNAGNFRSERGRMKNGRQEQARAVAEIAKKYNDPYASRFKKEQVSYSKVSLEGIPEEYLPEDRYDDDSRAYTFYYPPSQSIPLYMQQINGLGIQISESFKNQDGSYENLVKLIARQYQYGAIICPFSQINNSLFMNLANAQLKMLGLLGISHYNLDLAAQRMQQDEFTEYFLDIVKKHNKNFVFSEKISEEKSNLPVSLNNVSDVEKLSTSLTTGIVKLLEFSRETSRSDYMDVFFKKENSSVIEKFPGLSEKDIFINGNSFKDSGFSNLVVGDLVTIEKKEFPNLITTYLVSNLEGQVVLVDNHIRNTGETYVPAQTISNFFRVEDNITLIIREGHFIGITDNNDPTKIEVNGGKTKTGIPKKLHPSSLVSINRTEGDPVELILEFNDSGKLVLNTASHRDFIKVPVEELNIQDKGVSFSDNGFDLLISQAFSGKEDLKRYSFESTEYYKSSEFVVTGNPVRIREKSSEPIIRVYRGIGVSSKATSDSLKNQYAYAFRDIEDGKVIIRKEMQESADLLYLEPTYENLKNFIKAGKNNIKNGEARKDFDSLMSNILKSIDQGVSIRTALVLSTTSKLGGQYQAETSSAPYISATTDPMQLASYSKGGEILVMDIPLSKIDGITKKSLENGEEVMIQERIKSEYIVAMIKVPNLSNSSDLAFIDQAIRSVEEVTELTPKINDDDLNKKIEQEETFDKQALEEAQSQRELEKKAEIIQKEANLIMERILEDNPIISDKEGIFIQRGIWSSLNFISKMDPVLDDYKVVENHLNQISEFFDRDESPSMTRIYGLVSEYFEIKKNGDSEETPFEISCSSCSKVKDQTISGMNQVDIHLSSFREKLKQVEELTSKASSENNPDEAKQLKAEARRLEQEAENLRKLALAQIDKTRKEVVDEHSMQNKCVQFYLRTRVDVKEAEIRNNAVYISKAFTSLDKTQHIAEKLLAEGKMEIVTKVGFFGFGRESHTIDLEDQDKEDIRNIIDNTDEDSPGLKQLREVLSKLKKQPNSRSFFSNVISNITGQFRIWRESLGTRWRWFSNKSVSTATFTHSLKNINPLTGKAYSTQELADLRSITKDDYKSHMPLSGKGLINTAHAGANSYEDHKQAQNDIFDPTTDVGKSYQAVLAAGIVRPDAIGAEIKMSLLVDDQEVIEVSSVEEIKNQLTLEMDRISHLGLTQEEKQNVIDASYEFAETYSSGFPEANPTDVAQFSVDTARMLVYQVIKDKDVFSGSDHGDLHIIQGDYNNGKKLIDSLKELGIELSDKEKSIWSFATFIHDLGYTTGIAQAKYSFEASKDHPIFSVGFIDANRDYIIERFGEDGFESVREIVLMHSYPNHNFDPFAVNESGIHQELLNQVLSLPDSLGVTAETKAPQFFRYPEVIIELQRIRLYSDIIKKQYPDDSEIVKEKISNYVASRREKLLFLVKTLEPNELRQASFISAIENQFNEITVNMTLGLYTGTLNSVSFIKNEQGKIIPNVEMNVSSVQAILADVFGDKVSIQAFVKAMKDLGVDQQTYSKLADDIRDYKKASSESKKEIVSRLKIVSDNAQFTFDPDASFNSSFDYTELFIALTQQTIRGDLNYLAESILSSENRDKARLFNLTDNFLSSISSRDILSETEYLDLAKLITEINNLSETSSVEEVELLVDKLLQFTSVKELEFLEIDSPTTFVDKESLVKETRFKAVERFVEKTLKVIPSNLTLHELKNVLGKVNRLIEKNSMDDYLLIVNSKKASVVFARLRNLASSLVVTGNSNNDSGSSSPAAEKSEEDFKIGNLGPGSGLRKILMNLPLLLSGGKGGSGEASPSAEEAFTE
ncbi:MAG: hypothetical protein HN981_04470 [Candidatus Pacebacteria bacterium]|jgi:hypothetical protein|nr:hypothetical protein [Candidatus Paceibacterota bacterium]MBT6756328.1 hypothetical protein [Candidatus Paceibacterota bacterium]MBT6921619.1 hypothetical protein [Candidatus Paceibacterota bacterium]